MAQKPTADSIRLSDAEIEILSHQAFEIGQDLWKLESRLNDPLKYMTEGDRLKAEKRKDALSEKKAQIEERLARHDAQEDDPPIERHDDTTPAEHLIWPWGSHETKLLRHLAEAAKQWWSTFDPGNPRTAPTNEEVTEWLVSREVSRRTAEVMATILRADGLPTGPRT